MQPRAAAGSDTYADGTVLHLRSIREDAPRVAEWAVRRYRQLSRSGTHVRSTESNPVSQPTREPCFVDISCRNGEHRLLCIVDHGRVR